jgi:hypothetical protein
MTKHRFEWSALAPLLVLGIGALAYLLTYTFYGRHIPVDADGEGYYAYLPAYLLDHDPSFKTVLLRDILPQYAGLGHQPPEAFGFSAQPTGAWLDKYGVGVAILVLPVFALGHVIAVMAGVNADGYSRPEVFTVGLAALGYTVLGLFALRALLRRWFSDRVVAAALIGVTFGTGTIVYLSWAPLVSHDFTFFAVASMLLGAQRWFERPGSWSRAALLGLAMGVVVAIRLPNVVLLVAVPLLGVGGSTALKTRLTLLRTYASRLAVAASSGLLVLVPQVITWYYATGHLITRPYPGESFDFLHPHLVESLLWFEPHGMIPFYPVLGLALVGLGVAWFRRRDLALPVTAAFLLFWYLVSAWHDWSYSDAFGDRAFIDVAPLLALPLATLFASVPRRVSQLVLGGLAGALVAITCAMTVAYMQRRMPDDGIDASGYFQILLHPLRLLKRPIPSHLAVAQLYQQAASAPALLFALLAVHRRGTWRTVPIQWPRCTHHPRVTGSSRAAAAPPQSGRLGDGAPVCFTRNDHRSHTPE